MFGFAAGILVVGFAVGILVVGLAVKGLAVIASGAAVGAFVGIFVFGGHLSKSWMLA